MSYKDLIDNLVLMGAIKTSSVEAAFRFVKREDFVRPEHLAYASKDNPLPIGQGATISQPYTVAFMLEHLNCKKGHKVLDVGCGSGWTSGLLAHITGPNGSVYGVELLPDILEFGIHNLGKYNFSNATLYPAYKKLGLPKHGPYDRILVSAAAQELPNLLVKQLKPNGIMVIPIQNSICKISKTTDHTIEKTEFPGFVFVPLKSS
jgi:protein-L-isoaspartate(D-aspartate) O-methyltransferase